MVKSKFTPLKKRKKPKDRRSSGRTPKWYDEQINRPRIEKFFDELRRIRIKYINNYGDLDVEDIDTEVIRKKKFLPKGVVIHTSGMRTIKETIEYNNSGYFSSHFIITSNNYKHLLNKKDFPLLSQIPASIIMLHDIDKHIPHSGYLSPVTWGIEMRNLGLLRPNEEKFIGPINASEYNEYDQRLWMRKPVYYYSREEQWTTPYEGPAYTWQGYHYEKFTSGQYIALCVLLKCLTTYFRDQINAALYLPSSAVIDKPHNCPIIPIDFFQKKALIINTQDKLYRMGGLYNVTDCGNLFTKETKVEGESDTHIDDCRIIEDRIKENAWRANSDREKLSKVFKHGDKKFVEVFHYYKKALETMGYCTHEHYVTKSLQLYANAREIELENDVLMFELEKDFYNLVNGAYLD